MPIALLALDPDAVMLALYEHGVAGTDPGTLAVRGRSART